MCAPKSSKLKTYRARYARLCIFHSNFVRPYRTIFFFEGSEKTPWVNGSLSPMVDSADSLLKKIHHWKWWENMIYVNLCLMVFNFLEWKLVFYFLQFIFSLKNSKYMSREMNTAVFRLLTLRWCTGNCKYGFISCKFTFCLFPVRLRIESGSPGSIKFRIRALCGKAVIFYPRDKETRGNWN